MSNDSLERKQSLDVGFVHSRNPLQIKAVKCLAKTFASLEDGEPGEPSLKAFE